MTGRLADRSVPGLEAPMGPPRAGLPELTVYYDGGCPVCAREIAAYRRRPSEGEIRWVDASRCSPESLGGGLGRDAALARLHVRRADGSLTEGVAAFAMLWQRLPGLAGLGRLALLPGVRHLLEGAYAAFLQLRRAWRRH